MHSEMNWNPEMWCLLKAPVLPTWRDLWKISD